MAQHGAASLIETNVFGVREATIIKPSVNGWYCVGHGDC